MADTSHLFQVFQACDRGGKGHLTSEDIQAACAGLLAEEEKEKIVEIFRSENDAEMDFKTFVKLVGKYFLEEEEESRSSYENSREMARGPELSSGGGAGDILRISGFSRCSQQQVEEGMRSVSPPFRIQSKELCGSSTHVDEGSLSPFTPMLNSSSFLTDSNAIKQQDNAINMTTRLSLLCRPPSGLGITNRAEEDTFEASGDEKMAPVPSKLRKRGLRDSARKSRKIRKCGNEAGCSSSADTSPFRTPHHPDRVTLKMEELTKKLEEVKEATAQSKMEISSLFDHFLNKSAERSEDEYLQQEKRRKIDELVRMETELLRLKLEAQVQENEKLRAQNRDIWDRLQDIEKEKQNTSDRLSRQKSFSSGLEEKLHQIRLENRELNHQLDTARLDMKNLEEHLFYLEERRTKEVVELEENKKLFEAEKSRMRKEKMRLIEERDRLSSRQTELNNEQEEIQAERRLIQIDSDRLRMEKENFFSTKTNFEARKNEDEFVLIECTSDFSNLLTQNEILKSSLDQLANEKAGLVHQLRMTQDQLAKEKAGLVHQLRAAQDQLAMRDQQESQAAANFKLEQMQEEQRQLTVSLKEKELVISSLMEVVEKSRKVDSGRRCSLEHQAELGEQTRRLAQQVRSLEAGVSSAREVLELCPAKLRQHLQGKDDSAKLKKEIAGLEQEVKQLTVEKNQLIKYVELLVKRCNEKLTAKRS